MSNKNNYFEYTPDLSSLNENTVQEDPRPEKSPRRNVSNNGNKKGTKRKENVKENQGKKNNIITRLKNAYAVMTGQSARILFGIFLMCLCIYLLVSFISYFSTCISDQSMINQSTIGNAPHTLNKGGEGGARLSEFLINECFGIGSFVIIIWLLAMSLKMLIGKPKFKSVNFTIKCIIALITVSLIIGLVTISSHSPINWGGYHGLYVNEFIINFIGLTGATLLSLFMISVFVVICLRDVIMWIVRKVQKHRELKRQALEEKREIEEREAAIRKMKETEEIDDIKAGESTPITSVADDVNELETQLEFATSDSPLYKVEEEDEITLEENDNQQFYKETEQENSETSPNFENIDIENSSGNITADDETITTDSADSAVNDKAMTVKVNTIGQSEERHFKSELEMLESRPYKFPPYDLLKSGSQQVEVSQDEQLANQAKIEKTLLDFGIPIQKISATVGPTITLYEIVPDSGVTIAKIRRLVDDIALSLSAIGVRIIAPIPGKGTVGIEVANKNPLTVSMRTVIQSKKFQESKYKLPIALGSTISNDVYIADLAKMPHLLVAGATGQGKSVGLNAMIASLLYCKAPWQLKFVLIDPKQVEFALYNKIKNYYMAVLPGEEDEDAVITDMKKVEAILNSLCIEMDNRYTLLRDAGVRNIEEYNDKIRKGVLNPAEGHRFLPYIVVVVDEFGDLIMVLGKGVETPIARLAQKARAVGMHVIIATQRPSANVITGIIKANFPARLAFKVASGVDSKTILDASGAQQLIGRGDMLIFHNSEMMRVQCAFIDTPEVETICEYISHRPYPTGPYILPEPILPGNEDSNKDEANNLTDRDPLFEDVARAIVNGRTASTSSIQRHYAIGYTRAARIVDQLERAGIVGPNQGGKPRSVLVDLMELENILNSF